ncbi:MAG: hypothetical protein ACT4OP_06290 [Actinomycetota bacterium]
MSGTFAEMIPWVLGGLVVGFVIGLMYRRRKWSRQLEMNAREVHTARSLTAEYERKVAEASRRLESRTTHLSSMRERVHELETEKDSLIARIARLEKPDSPPMSGSLDHANMVIDLTAGARLLGVKIRHDDLQVVEGIGPKIEQLITNAGITTWRELAQTDLETLRRILDAAGPRFRIHDPATWPRQAQLLSEGRWADFKELTDQI